MNKKEGLSLSGSADTQSPPTDINSHSHRVVRRRSFLKGLGMAGATLLPASALLMTKGEARSTNASATANSQGETSRF